MWAGWEDMASCVADSLSVHIEAIQTDFLTDTSIKSMSEIKLQGYSCAGVIELNNWLLTPFDLAQCTRVANIMRRSRAESWLELGDREI